MIPSAEDIAAAKAACLKKFGHERVVGVWYHDPVTGDPLTRVLLAALDWQAAVTYQDNRASNVGRARSLLFAERQLYPSSEALAPIRETWAAFALTVETAYRILMGFSDDGPNPTTAPLTAATAPPGLDAKACEAMLAANAGSRLWSVYLADNGLALVWRQPAVESWMMSQTTIGEAQRAKRNVLCPALGTMADHCLWTPDGSLQAHLDAAPGRGRDLEIPWSIMGGLAAKASASFL